MPNSNNKSYSNPDRSPELLVKDLEELGKFVNHPAWVELVDQVRRAREDAISAFVNLSVKDLGTFLEREQLIGEARALESVLRPVIEKFEELKQQTEELTQQ